MASQLNEICFNFDDEDDSVQNLSDTFQIIEINESIQGSSSNSQIIEIDEDYQLFKNWDIIPALEAPLTDKWCFPILVSTAGLMSERVWQIAFDGQDILIKFGQKNGVIQTQHRKVVPKSKTLLEQALQEMRKRRIDKIREGYLEYGSTDIPMINVMRGLDFEKHDHTLIYPVWCDTKLDGIRAWVRNTMNGPEGLSRNNTKFPYINDIIRECEYLLNYLPTGSALDGEIYSHDLEFQDITGIIRTKNFKHPDLTLLDYHMFDIYTPQDYPFEKRCQILEKAISLYREETFNYGGEVRGFIPELKARGSRIFLANGKFVENRDELDQYYHHCLHNGYEGIMVKRLANSADVDSEDYKKSIYKFCGSAGTGCNHILKRKPVFTEEALCIDTLEATGNQKGCVILVVVDIRGNVFKVVPIGPVLGHTDNRRYIAQNPELVLGKIITIEYRGLTQKGVPKFAKALEIRNYEGGNAASYNLFEIYTRYQYLGREGFDECK